MNCEIDIKQAVECLRNGGVILYPTDTVWGIGCDATNEEAVRRIYEIKQREDAKSMLCLVDKADRIQRYFREVPDVAWDILDNATSDALSTFQQITGLPMTGNLDKQTWKHLALHYPLAVNLLMKAR